MTDQTGTSQEVLDAMIEAARTKVRIAEIRINAEAADLPLRYKVEDARRLRAARDELEDLLELEAE